MHVIKQPCVSKTHTHCESSSKFVFYKHFIGAVAVVGSFLRMHAQTQTCTFKHTHAHLPSHSSTHSAQHNKNTDVKWPKQLETRPTLGRVPSTVSKHQDCIQVTKLRCIRFYSMGLWPV